MRHASFPRTAALCFCVIAAAALSSQTAAAAGSKNATWSTADCLRALDRAEVHANDIDYDTAQRGLATLAQSCESVPQVHHNLGVIAARNGQWEIAIAAFKRAIAIDTRTADTVTQLNAIHAYQAKLAWQVALDRSDPIEPPTFVLQTSADQNPAPFTHATNQSALRSVATVDFELYTWWHASSESQENEAWLSHYVKGYPPTQMPDTKQIEWDSVKRDIQFTARDASVALSWTHGREDHVRILLLRLNGQRWQIYHEAEL